jgi:hypothetical protein
MFPHCTMWDALQVAQGGEWVGLHSQKGSVMGGLWFSRRLPWGQELLRNGHTGHSDTSEGAGLGLRYYSDVHFKPGF